MSKGALNPAERAGVFSLCAGTQQLSKGRKERRKLDMLRQPVVKLYTSTPTAKGSCPLFSLGESIFASIKENEQKARNCTLLWEEEEKRHAAGISAEMSIPRHPHSPEQTHLSRPPESSRQQLAPFPSIHTHQPHYLERHHKEIQTSRRRQRRKRRREEQTGKKLTFQLLFIHEKLRREKDKRKKETKTRL